MNIEIILGIMIPFVGTLLGASLVFLLKKEMPNKMKRILTGFAAGVMMSASMWCLLEPSVELSVEQGFEPWFPAAIGFLLGTAFMLLTDRFFCREHSDSERKLNTKLLVISVTLHNIPEGMAVGAVFAAMIASGTNVTFASALSLAIGIALQNIPEGAIVSMPVRAEGASKKKCFGFGVISGIVEPISALITILFFRIINPALPFLLSFAAGAMIYVVVKELIPSVNSEDSKGEAGVIALVAGFLVMMIIELIFEA